MVLDNLPDSDWSWSCNWFYRCSSVLNSQELFQKPDIYNITNKMICNNQNSHSKLTEFLTTSYNPSYSTEIPFKVLKKLLM